VRKKDLELGGVYAEQYGRPQAVLSTRIWMQDRYSREWKMYPKRVNVPSRGTLWNETKGILVVEGGSADKLRAFVKDCPELHQLEEWEKGEPRELSEPDKRIKWVESVAHERGLRVAVADYRRWVGTPEEAEARAADQERRREQDREQAAAEARPVRERAARVQERARRLLGQDEAWGYTRWTRGWVQVGDASESVPDEVKLSVEELERLVAMAERGRTE